MVEITVGANITELQNNMKQATNVVNDFKNNGQRSVDTIKTSFGSLGASLTTLRRELQEVGLAMTEAAKAGNRPEYDKLKQQYTEIKEAARLFRAETVPMANQLGVLASGFGTMASMGANLAMVFGSDKKSSEELFKTFAKVQGITNLAAGFGQLVEEGKKMGPAFDALTKYLFGYFAATKTINTAQEESVAITEANTISNTSFATTIGEVTLLKSAETTATEGATVAQEDLNVAMESNPIGLILLAITALVAGIYGLTKVFKDSTAEVFLYNKAMDDLVKGTPEQKKAIDDLRDSIYKLGIQYKVETGQMTKEAGQQLLNEKQKKKELGQIYLDAEKDKLRLGGIYNKAIEALDKDHTLTSIERQNGYKIEYQKYNDALLGIDKARHNHVMLLDEKYNTDKKILDAEVLAEKEKADKKAYDDYVKNSEELRKKIEEIQVKETDDKVIQIQRQLAIDIEETQKMNANEEEKHEYIRLLNEKAAKDIEDIWKKSAEDAEKLRKEEAKKIQDFNDKKLANDIKDVNDRIKNTKELNKKVSEYNTSDLQKELNVLKDQREAGIKTLNESENTLTGKGRQDLLALNAMYDDLDHKAKEKYKKSALDDILSSLGVSDADLKKVEDSLKQCLQLVEKFVQDAEQSNVDAAKSKVDSLNKEIDGNQKSIETEQRDADAGRNNSLTAVKKQDALLKSQRDAALKDEQKAKKEQLLINEAIQASELVVAIVKAYAASDILVGTIEAVALVAAFALAVSNANKAAKSATYGGGGSWLLQGDSHEQGGINLGGGREAEGGERVAVFSRRATSMNNGLPEFIDAINKGQLIIDKNKMELMTDKIINKNNITVNVAGQKELQRIEKLLYEQGIRNSNGRSVKYGTTTTIYKN